MARIRSLFRFTVLTLILLGFTGCATSGRNLVGPTPMQVAQDPYPSEQLLKVGIELFNPGNLSATAMEEQHTTREIRETETQFMPYHLKTTLEQSGFWGEVRVIPENAGGVDVRVTGTVIESNGENLALDIKVVDSQGYVWIDRVYRDRLTKEHYEEVIIGKRGPFQNIYNKISNDMATVRRRMDAVTLQRLQRTTQLLFAAELVPDAYKGYVREVDGKQELVRLPAEDDPLWRKVNQVSVRNEVFFDALNRTYEPFYQQMWKPYMDWRRYNLIEQLSIRQARSDSIKQAAAGIIMIAAAILLEANEVDNSSTLRDVLVLGGSQVIINGVNISKAADIHRETLRELATSFSSDAESIRVEYEGMTVELIGSVEEQMAQWQELLRKVHAQENAFPETDLSDD